MMVSPKKWIRSEHDEWDILSSVGYTALMVAGWRAVHAAGPHPLVRDDHARHFVTASGDPYWTATLANPGTSDDATAFPRLYGVQTRFFDDFFQAGAHDGVRQAVIVAAGLDSRAYRLDWPSGTTVFEIDQPKVLEFKSRVLARAGAEPSADRREIPADLRDDWSIPLTAAGFDPGRPAAWSVEGLLPYLTGAAQDALFTEIGRLSAAGSRLAVGALGSCLDSEQLSALANSHPGVNMSGDVDFSALAYDPGDKSDPAEWLPAHGWSIEHLSTNPELQAGYGRNPAGVDTAIDRVMHSQYITATRL